MFLLHFYPRFERNVLLSPPQTTRDSNERKEMKIFLKFLDTVRKTFNHTDIPAIVKLDRKKVSAWFIIEFFEHNIDPKEQTKNNFAQAVILKQS